MATRHFVRGASGAEKVFLTNWTVGHVFSRLAVVILEEQSVDAHPTVVAVPEAFATSHTAETAVSTMIWILILRHPKIANVAVVFSKLNLTVDAIIPAFFKRRFRSLFDG
jgi:hypothetical protein